MRKSKKLFSDEKKQNKIDDKTMLDDEVNSVFFVAFVSFGR